MQPRGLLYLLLEFNFGSYRFLLIYWDAKLELISKIFMVFVVAGR